MSDQSELLGILERQLAEARGREDEQTEIRALEEIVVAAVRAGRVDVALARVKEVEALHRAAGREFEAIRAAYLRGRMEARDPATVDTGEATLQRALAESRAVGAPRIGGRTAARLATIAASREQWDVALARVDDAIDAFRVAGDEQGRLLEMLRMRALFLTLLDAPEEAFAAVSEALRLAGELGLHELWLTLRLDRAQLLRDDPSAAEEVDQIVTDAQAMGIAPMAALLDRAATSQRAGRGDDALRDALEARDLAMETIEPVHFLLASVMVGEILASQGRHADALYELAFAKTKLGELLGRPAAEAVAHYMESLEQAWGSATFEAALDALERDA